MGDVPTRWGSTYVMVDRILEQQQAISATLAGERKYWNKMPTDTEFTTLETLADVLKPWHVLTDALAGEQQVTASALIPILKHAKDSLSPGSGDSSLRSELKSKSYLICRADTVTALDSQFFQWQVFWIQDSKIGT